jgi:hypothetical protein
MRSGTSEPVFYYVENDVNIMTEEKNLEKRAERRLLWAEIRVTKIIIVFFFFVLFFGMLFFLLENRHNFDYVIQVVLLSTTLGGLTFTASSFYREDEKFRTRLSRSAAEFIIAGFLILSTFLLNHFPLPLNVCLPNLTLMCAPEIVVRFFEFAGVVGGPLFLAAGFYRLVSVMEEMYAKTLPNGRYHFVRRNSKE